MGDEVVFWYEMLSVVGKGRVDRQRQIGLGMWRERDRISQRLLLLVALVVHGPLQPLAGTYSVYLR